MKLKTIDNTPQRVTTLDTSQGVNWPSLDERMQLERKKYKYDSCFRPLCVAIATATNFQFMRRALSHVRSAENVCKPFEKKTKFLHVLQYIWNDN